MAHALGMLVATLRLDLAMLILAHVLVVLVALLHVYFLVLEMFLWTRPLGLKTCRDTPEKAATARVLAANQGLYNGFLAAGLVWGLLTTEWNVVVFFLSCVIVAARYGCLLYTSRCV